MSEKCEKCRGYLYSGWHTNCPGKDLGKEADDILCLMLGMRNEEHERQLARVRRMMAWCIWCGKVFTGDPQKEEDVARIRREMQEHDRSCPENPLAEEVKRLREIVLPIGVCGIAWEPCARSHTPDESRKMKAARKAHDAAYDYAHETVDAKEALGASGDPASSAATPGQSGFAHNATPGQGGGT